MALYRAKQAYRRGVRLAVTISPQCSAMIDELLATGLYGIDGRAGVAQRLIYAQLRVLLGPDEIIRAMREQARKKKVKP